MSKGIKKPDTTVTKEPDYFEENKKLRATLQARENEMSNVIKQLNSARLEKQGLIKCFKEINSGLAGLLTMLERK